MPNIEIHGLPGKEGDELSRKIFELFKHEIYIDEMVVTIFQDRVVDKKSSSQPFIRVVTTPHRYIGAILGGLRRFHVDIEHLELRDFIPKKPKREG